MHLSHNSLSLYPLYCVRAVHTYSNITYEGDEVEAGKTHWECSPPLQNGVAPHSLYFTLNSRVSMGQMCPGIRFTGALNFEPFLDNRSRGKESKGEDRSLRERAIKCTHESFSALSTVVWLALWFNCLASRCEKYEY